MIKKRLLLLAGILMALVTIVSGCSEARNGDLVSVNYTGTLADGTIFDTTIGGEPLQFTIGQGQVIPGFEQAIIGMKPGESKTVIVPMAEAYGPYDEELIFTIDRAQLPADLEPIVGQYLQGTLPDGNQITALITNISESSVTLDANHPLAGKDLTFNIELVDIN